MQQAHTFCRGTEQVDRDYSSERGVFLLFWEIIFTLWVGETFCVLEEGSLTLQDYPAKRARPADIDTAGHKEQNFGKPLGK